MKMTINNKPGKGDVNAKPADRLKQKQAAKAELLAKFQGKKSEKK